jgi:hypothetical protein
MRCTPGMPVYEGCTPTKDMSMRWPMGDARLWEMDAYERHAYDMAYGRCTPMRDTPMRWSMGDARLYGMPVYGMHTL